jgi:hypothetical protein
MKREFSEDPRRAELIFFSGRVIDALNKVVVLPTTLKC